MHVLSMHLQMAPAGRGQQVHAGFVDSATTTRRCFRRCCRISSVSDPPKQSWLRQQADTNPWGGNPWRFPFAMVRGAPCATRGAVWAKYWGVGDITSGIQSYRDKGSIFRRIPRWGKVLPLHLLRGELLRLHLCVRRQMQLRLPVCVLGGDRQRWSA